jgi:hypothetical protein
MSNSREVNFVYLGPNLPRYGLASIELASRYSGVNVHLIGNAKMARSLRNSPARFTAVEDFYNEAEFRDVSKRITFPHSFRQGFWLKTLERFFVLSQYMSTENLDSIFHAELDQLLFRADLLLSKLDEASQRGLFLPFHTADLAVASVFYCNSQGALRSLLDFASEAGTFSNEMMLIANWAKHNPEHMFPLPTTASVVDASANPPYLALTLNSNQIGGVVDAAQLGWWVAGVDPRNVPILDLPLTKFADKTEVSLMSRQQLSRLKFNFNPQDGFLNVEYGEEFDTKLFNLHIHSKIHRHLLRSDSSLERLFSQANQIRPTLIPGVRRVQLWSRLTVFLERVARNPESVIIGLRRRLNRWLSRRPTSSPFISGDTFRSMADHIWEAGHEAITLNEINPGDVIFCESERLDDLRERVLIHSRVPIILLLGNSDKNHTQSLVQLLAGTAVVSIFAQNLVDPVPGVEPLPIGLENAWHSKNGRPKDFRANRRKSQTRIFRVMWAFNLETNLIERSMAASELVSSPIADRLDPLTPRQHRRALSRYSFVASPPGNGLDTHRTWEAMYLGCLSVVLRSHMTQHYEQIGLPIWVVDSFEELRDLNEDQLRKKYYELSPKFGSEAMWASYWITRIKSHVL